MPAYVIFIRERTLDQSELKPTTNLRHCSAGRHAARPMESSLPRCVGTLRPACSVTSRDAARATRGRCGPALPSSLQCRPRVQGPG
jgi:hypothetical protein